MQNFKNSSSRVKATIFVDFKPAELKQSKEWIIVYYAKNPITQNLDRFRLRVPTMKGITERKNHAKRIILSINQKLNDGWSPFHEESGKNYKSFDTAIEEFLKGLDKMVSDDILRPDTQRTYNSYCNLLQKFVKEKMQITFALEINRKFCVEYLDWIYLDRESSARTRNNHAGFLNIFCNFLLQRGIIGENPVKGLPRFKLPPKKRIAFNSTVKEKINGYFNAINGSFETVCMATYYCFLRSTELSKLKVQNIDIENASIFISKDISKNKKDETITIPDQFIDRIKNHIKNANPDDYVFSNKNFNTGTTKMGVRYISNHWDKLRDKLNLDSTHQFYGFKDTGIQDLLNSGIAAIKVRDQARHYDIKITEIYAQRKNTIDESIKTANLQF